jgi:hypothetical protein
MRFTPQSIHPALGDSRVGRHTWGLTERAFISLCSNYRACCQTNDAFANGRTRQQRKRRSRTKALRLARGSGPKPR